MGPKSPRSTGISREVTVQNAAMLNGTPPESIVDVVIITTHTCAGCDMPHIIRVSSTTQIPDSIVAICAMAITDILEAYGPLPEDGDGNLCVFGGTND